MLSSGWTDHLAQYAGALCAAQKAPRTVDKYTADTQKFLHFLGSAALDEASVSAYRAFLRSRYQANTCNSYLISLNGFLRFIGRAELVLPLHRLQRRFSLEHELTVADYRRILAALRGEEDPKYYLIARTLAGTGIRVGELPFFTVRALERGWIEAELKGKVRQVFLPTALQTELSAYATRQKITSGPVFLNRARSMPLDASLIWRRLKKAARMVGVPEERAFPHNLRHLFARVYMDTYGNIVELADLLGHSSVETTRIYTRTTSTEKIRRISGLGL